MHTELSHHMGLELITATFTLHEVVSYLFFLWEIFFGWGVRTV